MGGAIALWIVGVLAYLVVLASVAYIAVHFIEKFW